MKIPRYWKQVVKHVEGINFHSHHAKLRNENSADIYAWGYSDTSEQQALERANHRIEQIVDALSSERDDNFYYPLNVLREDILQELSNDTGGRALITRNRYFSQVLNAEHLMFVDIDVPIGDIKPPGFWQRIFGKATAIEAANKLQIEKRFSDALIPLNEYLAGERQVGFKVYRTFAGYRLIATHKAYDPVSQETQQVFDALGTDPLYQKLCKAQACFRARLTAKYWRLKVDLGEKPSIHFRVNQTMLAQWSENDTARVEKYDQWTQLYDKQHDSHATCQFVKHVGNTKIAKELESLINYHDQVTQAYRDKPLA